MSRNRFEQRGLVALAGLLAVVVSIGPGSCIAAAATPNLVADWNHIAEDAVVHSGAFQNEGLLYMAYVSAAVYDAVVAIEGGYQPYGPGVTAPAGASVDAAV